MTPAIQEGLRLSTHVLTYHAQLKRKLSRYGTGKKYVRNIQDYNESALTLGCLHAACLPTLTMHVIRQPSHLNEVHTKASPWTISITPTWKRGCRTTTRRSNEPQSLNKSYRCPFDSTLSCLKGKQYKRFLGFHNLKTRLI